jgi:hypothetical protein
MAGYEIQKNLGRGYEPFDEGTLQLRRTPSPGTLRLNFNNYLEPLLKIEPGIFLEYEKQSSTRQIIIDLIRKAGIEFKARSDWKAKEIFTKLNSDWNYKAIAIHHAGNDFSCSANGVSELQKAEKIDINSFGHFSYHYAIDCQGTIYEALDIRQKGAHIENGNTGVIGVVFLADFSVRGEAEKYGPGVKNVIQKHGVVAGVKEWVGVQKDKVDFINDYSYDPSTDNLHKATDVLVKTLSTVFNIKQLGGHREFAKIHGTSRACPGIHGLIIADMLRKKFSLLPP